MTRGARRLIGRALCLIGLHRWDTIRYDSPACLTLFTPTVDAGRRCLRCGAEQFHIRSGSAVDADSGWYPSEMFLDNKQEK